MTEEEKDAYIKKLLTSNIDQHNKVSFLSKKVQDLQKKNSELEAQIEKIKRCGNCKSYKIPRNWCNNIKSYRNWNCVCEDWEIKEK